MVNAGIPTDPKKFNDRIQNLMDRVLDSAIATTGHEIPFASRIQDIPTGE